MESPTNDSNMAINGEVGLHFEDPDIGSTTMIQLHVMRTNDRFCDARLMVGAHEVPVHRGVLAASSKYFLDLFVKTEDDWPAVSMYKLKDIDHSAFQCLLTYMYTGRLDVPKDEVSSVYRAALQLRLDHAATACAGFLSQNLTPENCLGIRTCAAESDFKDCIDAYIRDHITDVTNSKRFYGLPRVAVEIVGIEDDVLISTGEKEIIDLVLTWAKGNINPEKARIDSLTEQLNVLYLDTDNTLRDCKDMEEASLQEDEIVQDYKKLAKRKQSGQVKSGRESPEQGNAGNFQKFKISPTTPMQEKEWATIAAYKAKDRTYMAIAMLNGILGTVSVHYRTTTGNNSSTEEPDSPVSTLRQSKPYERHASLTPLDGMGTPRCGFGLKVLNGCLFACGGYDRGECLKSCEEYSIQTNKWKPLEEMKCPRGRFSVARLKEKIYAIGGSNGHDEVKIVECYDQAQKSWSVVCNAPKAKASPGIAEFNNQLYVIGGSMGQSAVTDCEAFDPETGKWRSIAPLNVGRYQVAVHSFAGKLFAVGGTNGWQCLNSTEIYDPEANVWHLGPPLNINRRGPGVDIFNGTLYVVGGNDGTSALNSTEIYDIESNCWKLGPTLSTPRANPGVAAFESKLFAVGGFNGKKFLQSMEFLDVQHQEWWSYLPKDATANQKGPTLCNGNTQAAKQVVGV